MFVWIAELQCTATGWTAWACRHTSTASTTTSPVASSSSSSMTSSSQERSTGNVSYRSSTRWEWWWRKLVSLYECYLHVKTSVGFCHCHFGLLISYVNHVSALNVYGKVGISCTYIMACRYSLCGLFLHLVFEHPACFVIDCCRLVLVLHMVTFEDC